MAENSRSCKVWCVTIVAAVLVLVARTGEPRHALIAIIPLLMFLVLDAYYLGLERGFRATYNSFVGRLREQEATLADLYQVATEGSNPKRFSEALLRSFAILPFYAALAITVILAWLIIL